MKITKIVGEHGVLKELCNGGSCPAAVLTEGGDVFIQGYIPAQSESAALVAPSGENFVRMSRETFAKIARQVLAG